MGLRSTTYDEDCSVSKVFTDLSVLVVVIKVTYF